MFEISPFFTGQIFIALLALSAGVSLALGAFFVKTKGSHNGIAVMINAYYIATGLVFIPFVSPPPLISFIFMLAAGVVYIGGIQARYAAYRKADLGVVYPSFNALTVLLTALFGFIILREPLSILHLAALAMVMLGIYSIYKSTQKPGGNIHLDLSTMGLIFLAALALALYIGLEAIGIRYASDPISYIPYAMVFSAVPIVIQGFIFDRKKNMPFIKENWKWCFWPFVFNAWNYAASLYVVFYAQVTEYVIYEKAGIITSMALGILFLNEKPSWHRAFGASLVVVGIVLISYVN
jgi:drug/metabolite transporter (DMT)-like permease